MPIVIIEQLGLLQKLLDRVDQLAAIVSRDGQLIFANQLAQTDVERDNQLWPRLRSVADAIRTQGNEMRVRIEGETGTRWDVLGWMIDGKFVAFLGSRASEASPARRLMERIGLEPAEARLALHVAEGRSNSNIANLLRASSGAIKSRLYSLYRKAGVRNRAQLVAMVLRALGRDGQ